MPKIQFKVKVTLKRNHIKLVKLEPSAASLIYQRKSKDLISVFDFDRHYTNHIPDRMPNERKIYSLFK